MAGRSERLFVITGGPGSGKTTLIEALARAGRATSAEAGRGLNLWPDHNQQTVLIPAVQLLHACPGDLVGGA